MIKPGLFICLTLFLTGLFPGTAKPEMAVEDTGFEEVEITGLFSVGGKPMVSLSIRNSSSFTLKIGQRRRGIKLLQVKGDEDPYVVLERNGLQGRVFLNKSRPSRANREIARQKLQRRGGVLGLLYVKGENEPFTGTAFLSYANGSMSEVTPYVDGKINGMQINYYENGSKYGVTPFVNGQKDGKQIWYNKDGSKSKESVYENGKLHGTEIDYHKDGSRLETPYENSKKHGTEISYYPNGTKRYEKPWVNGKQHGTAITYYADGSKSSETPFVDGHSHGMAIHYYHKGTMKYETPYLNGKHHGKDIWYNEDGSKRLVIVYKNGKKISRKEF